MSIFVSVLESGLKLNFSEVSCAIVDSPDFTQAPFHLAAAGLGGDQTIVEFGGPPYLLPHVDRSKVYDLIPVIRQIDGFQEKDFFTCGAGAGPWPVYDQNCEGIMNLSCKHDGSVVNETHVARTSLVRRLSCQNLAVSRHDVLCSATFSCAKESPEKS